MSKNARELNDEPLRLIKSIILFIDVLAAYWSRSFFQSYICFLIVNRLLFVNVKQIEIDSLSLFFNRYINSRSIIFQ